MTIGFFVEITINALLKASCINSTINHTGEPFKYPFISLSVNSVGNILLGGVRNHG